MLPSAQANDSLRIDIQPVVDSFAICLGNSAVFAARTFPADLPITWIPDDGSVFPLSDTTVEITPETSGWYYARTEQESCVALDSIFLNVVPIELSIDSVPPQCAGAIFALNATANVDGEYFWMPEGLEGPNVIADPQDTTRYTLSFTSGCGTVTEEILLFADENPAVSIFCFNPADTTVLVEGFETNLTVLPNDTPGALIEWNTEETSARIVVKPQAPKTNYSVTVSYPNGCSRTADKGLEVRPADVKMPNAFTPDRADNNFFRPVFDGQMEVLSFEVFNRWGAQVFNNDNPEGWDGNYQSKPAASDVYLYRIEVERSNGARQVLQGNVTLIR
ncbi:MAG: T9SS type B sorting domain-containing protein [Bacteroidota bacterium]